MCCVKAFVRDLTIWHVLVGLFFLYHAFHRIRWNGARPRFDGKTVLITGASSGIGEELVRQMSHLGTKKIILAARRVAELERVRDQCIKEGSKC